jgi:RNA polymerase sigma factor (sigma-70 family)
MADAHPEEFSSLLEQARAGNADAQRRLVEQFGPTVLGVVRRRLNTRLRPLFDSADFTQNAWFEFFTKVLPHRTFASRFDLSAFLSVLARHTVDASNRKYLERQKHDLRRQQSLPSEDAADALADPGPSPDEIVAEDEAVYRLLQRLRPGERAVLHAMIAGDTHGDVAKQLGVDERTVARMVRRIVMKMEDQWPPPPRGGGVNGLCANIIP